MALNGPDPVVLAELAERLAAAADPSEVVAVITAEVPAVAGFDRADVAVVVQGELVSGRRRTRVDSDQPGARAIRERRIVVARVDDDPDVQADPRTTGVAAIADVPFVVAKGDLAGVLELSSRSPVCFDDATLGTVRLVGELCASAMRRTQTGDRAEQMAALAARLSGAVTAVDVAATLRDHGHQPVGAVHANCRLVNRRDRTLEGLVPAPLHEDLGGRYDVVPLDAPYPLSVAVLLDEPVWIPDVDDFTRRFPAVAGDVKITGFQATASVPLHDSAGAVVGVLALAWRNPVRFDRLVRSSVLTIADLAAQSLERARLTDAQARSARRNAEVARLGQLVAAAATVEEAAELLADEGGRVVGAMATNVAVHDEGSPVLRVVFDRHVDHRVAARLRTRALDEPSPHADAFRTGVAVVLESRDAFVARYPFALGEVEAAGVESAVVLPLLDHRGGPIGAMGFAWAERRAVEPDELAVLRTIAELGARALERARTSDVRTRDARSLGRFATALATAISRPQVLAVVAEHVPGVLGASEVELAVVEEGRPFAASPAAVAALDVGQTQVVSGVSSSAQIVVRDVAGRSTGVLSVGWSHEVTFDDALLARLSTLGDLLGQTLERAELYDRDHQLVASLQHRLLGSVVRPPDAELATRYLPAARSIGIGGDWFDVVHGVGRFTLVIGDVTGHGVHAVTAMAQLRTLIAGLLRSGERLDTVFLRVEAMLDRAELLLASAELFEVDLRTWVLRYVSAGHPWALLRRAGGEVVVLDQGQQALIGAPARPTPVPALALEPGDVLVAYTDGLVERRGEPITTGLARLVTCLESTSTDDLESLADELLDAAGVRAGAATDLDDDVALVVLRRPDPQQPAPGAAIADGSG